jgi:hypothetical protein
MKSLSPDQPATVLVMLQQMIDETEQRITDLHAQLGVSSETSRSEDVGEDSGQRRLDELEVFAVRLKQIYEWLKGDSQMITLVDRFLSDHFRQVEQRSMKRDYRVATVTTIIGAILGWLLSVLLPASLLITSIRK